MRYRHQKHHLNADRREEDSQARVDKIDLIDKNSNETAQTVQTAPTELTEPVGSTAQLTESTGPTGPRSDSTDRVGRTAMRELHKQQALRILEKLSNAQKINEIFNSVCDYISNIMVIVRLIGQCRLDGRNTPNMRLK